MASSIDVANGTVLAQPLHIVHVASNATPVAMFTRSLLRVGRDTGVTLVESYLAGEGAKAYQTHDGLIVAIGDNARLDHVVWSKTASMPSTFPRRPCRSVRTPISTRLV